MLHVDLFFLFSVVQLKISFKTSDIVRVGGENMENKKIDLIFPCRVYKVSCKVIFLIIFID